MNGTNPGFISALSGSQSITTGWLGAATRDVQFHIHIQFSGRLWSSASSKQWFNKGCLSLRGGPCPSRAFQSIIPMTQIRSLRLKDMEGPGSHSSSKTQVRLLEWDPLIPLCPDVPQMSTWVTPILPSGLLKFLPYQNPPPTTVCKTATQSPPPTSPAFLSSKALMTIWQSYLLAHLYFVLLFLLD